MKAFILFSVLFCLAGFSYSQQGAPETKPEFTRVMIGLNVTPDMGYRIRTENRNHRNYSYFQNFGFSSYEKEVPKLGFSAGMTMSFYFSRKVGIETGIQFANRGFTHEIDYLAQINMDPSIALAPPFYGLIPETIAQNYNWNYLEYPMRLVIVTGKQEMKFVASAGVCAGIFLNAHRTTIITYVNGNEEKGKSEISGYRPFSISPQVSFGADFQVSPLMNIRIEPIARYGLLSLIDSPINTNLISGGVLFSFYFAL